jgi:hypothetical protein
MQSEIIWNERYSSNSSLGSGSGSKGSLLDFKADFINSFIKENSISGVLDFGHGDLEVAKRISASKYRGIDIFDGSKFNSTDLDIKLCKFDEYNGEKFDLVICLDVLYHILENEQDYLRRSLDKMCESSEKFLIVYALDSRKDHETTHHMYNGRWLQHLLEKDNVELVFEQQEPFVGSSAKFFVFKLLK